MAKRTGWVMTRSFSDTGIFAGFALCLARCNLGKMTVIVQ